MKKGALAARGGGLLHSALGLCAQFAKRHDRPIIALGGALFACLLFLALFPHLKPEMHAVVGPAGGAGSPLVTAPQRALIERRLTVASGDTLLGLLDRAGVRSDDAEGLLAALSPLFAPADLQPGQTIGLTLTGDRPDAESRLDAVQIGVDPTHEIVASAVAPGRFAAKVVPLALSHRPRLVTGRIEATLYDAAQEAGLPPAVLMEMIRAYSFDVDFQRDVRPGDTFQAIYRQVYDAKGRYLGDGGLLFANLTLGGRSEPIYEYRTTEGFVDYFDGSGQSVRKLLMRTPVGGAWISSVFGWRKSPIDGYSEFHRGLDFAVPAGTPIMAAGNGSVVAAGWNDEYGNYVQLRHANGYETLYAHMAAFARGIRAGALVSQGEAIGFVGTTGMSTGPHLHYEVIYRGERINPATVASPAGPALAGDELRRFLAAKERIDEEYVVLKAGNPLPPERAMPRRTAR